MRPLSVGLPALSLLAFSLLTSGCATTETSEEAAVAPAHAPSGPQGSGFLEGVVNGGQQPLTSAQVYVFAASTTGNGGSGIAASTSNASTSLLSSTTTAVSGYPIVKDASTDITAGDYGVTTDANGGYKIPDVACTTGTQIYLVSIGGYYTSTASNPAAGLMAILGTCTGTTISSSIGTNTRIVMNEASTISAAYAVAGFATDAVHIGAHSSTNQTLAATGLANAFANANQLYSLSYGSTTVRTTTPNGNGTVPTSLLNSLANVLANCVNSAGATSGACSSSSSTKGLFYYATTTGVAGGTAPTETATAAINIAHFPANNVSTIFPLTSSTVNPFSPYLSTAPNDFNVSIIFSGSGLTASTSIAPHAIAVDSAGDVYMVSPGSTTSFAVFTPLGVAKTTTNSSYIATPYSVSLDINGNLWIPDYASYGVIEYVPSTGVFSGVYEGASAAAWYKPRDIEWDANGYGWIMCDYEGYMVQWMQAAGSYSYASGFSAPSSVALQSGTSGYAFATDTGYDDLFDLSQNISTLGYETSTNAGRGVAVDSSNKGWIAESATYVATMPAVSSQGTVAATQYSIKGSLANTPALFGVAIDGSSNVWITDTKDGTVVELNNAGTVISGGYGFVPAGNIAASSTTASGYPVHPGAIAVDGSGDVWYSTLTDSTLREIIGIATPLATPLVYGVVNSKVGQRP